MRLGLGLSMGQGRVASAPVYDPSVLSATLWQKGPYATPLPWAGTASAGISGTIQEANLATDPSNGTAVSGIVPPHYDEENSRTSQPKYISGGAAVDIADLVTVNQYTVWGLVKLASLPTPGAQPYLSQTIIAGDARFGVMFDSSGLGVYHYDALGGVFPHVQAACTAAAWHFFCIRFGGGIGSQTVQVDIDATAGTPTSLHDIAVLSGVSAKSGTNSFSTQLAPFDRMELMTLKTAISDTTRDNIYSYLKATYPGASLP